MSGGAAHAPSVAPSPSHSSAPASAARRAAPSAHLRITRLRYNHVDGCLGLDIAGPAVIPLDTITVVCGRNGAGKSLLAMALSGLLPRAEIAVERYQDGERIATLSTDQLREQSGIVFQNSEHQVIGQTVEDDIAFGLKNLRLKRAEIAVRTADILSLCDLTPLAARHPLSLSGGELRRVAIAAMIVMRPRVLILDEPFLNLDYHAQQQLSQLLLSLRRHGIAPIIVTHNLHSVHPYARWMIVMDAGSIVAAGPPHSVIECAVAHRLIDPDTASAARWH